MRRLALLAGAAALAAALCGCGRTSRLQGSLTEILVMEYEGAEAAVTPEALNLRFIRAEQCGSGLACLENFCVDPLCSGAACRGPGTRACTGGSDTVFQLTIDVSDLVLAANVQINLAEPAPRGGQRGVASRNLLADPRKTLPELEVGRLLLKDEPLSGGRLRGEFSLTFVQGIEYANGRTVFSPFTASVL